jgi:hypothetical protein
MAPAPGLDGATTARAVARQEDGGHKSARPTIHRPYFTSTASQAGLSSCRRAWKQRST